jgi:hypothetical protein
MATATGGGKALGLKEIRNSPFSGEPGSPVKGRLKFKPSDA